MDTRKFVLASLSCLTRGFFDSIKFPFDKVGQHLREMKAFLWGINVTHKFVGVILSLG